MEGYEVDALLDGYEDFVQTVQKTQLAKTDEEKETNMAVVFDKSLPKFLGVLEPMAAKGEWICGSKLTIADFWIGGIYTNTITNPDIWGKEKWATCLNDFPSFKAYGERFKTAMNKRLITRPSCPI